MAQGPGAPRGRSREYFDVIKAIGECKSKIEEDAIVHGEVRARA